jgi:hypothetical protein
MKFSNIKQNLPVLALACGAAVLMANPAYAQGLSGAKDALTSFYADLKLIVPIAATIALALLGVGYALKMVEKDTLFRWGIGIAIAGSAGTMAAMMYKPG